MEYDGQRWHAAQPVRAASPDDIALVLHTSGTTSRPKIVPLAHQNIAASARNIRKTLALTANDRGLVIMPLFHIHGLIAALSAPLSAGGEVCCSPGFNALKFFGWVDEVKPTWYTGVPTMHQAILLRAPGNQEIIKNHRLRFIRSSSSALPPTVIAELERVFGVPVVEAYGMTEAAHQMASNPLRARAEAGHGRAERRAGDPHRRRDGHDGAARRDRRDRHPGPERDVGVREQSRRRTPTRSTTVGSAPAIRA